MHAMAIVVVFSIHPTIIVTNALINQARDYYLRLGIISVEKC